MAAAHVIIGGGGGGGGSSGPLGELASNPFSDGTNGKSKARHSFVSFFLGTLFGNFITLIFMSMTLVLLGTGAWMAASCGQMSCEIYPDDFWSSWWLSWGVHFDPGTQTGIDPREGFKQKWVVVSFSILGFILNLIFLGLIVENIRVLLDSWRRTYGRIIENDHTVVLGWTDKVSERGRALGTRRRRRAHGAADGPLGAASSHAGGCSLSCRPTHTPSAVSPYTPDTGSAHARAAGTRASSAFRSLSLPPAPCSPRPLPSHRPPLTLLLPSSRPAAALLSPCPARVAPARLSSCSASWRR